jgi:hypothetical protein
MAAIREHVPDEIQARMQDADGAGAMAAHRIDWTDPEQVSDDALIAFVTHQYANGKARRYEWERDAAVQLAWVKGNQHLIWSNASRSLVDEGGDMDVPLEQREPVIINKLRGFVLAYLGMVLGGPITFQVYPQTNDNDDVANSRTLSKLVRHYFGASHLQGQTRLLEGFWTMFCTGVSFCRLTYDPFAGGEDWFSAGMMKQPGEDPQDPAMKAAWTDRLKQMVAGKRKVDPSKVKLKNGGIVLPRGEIDAEWITGFDVTEPEHSKNITNAGWILVSRFRPLEWLRQRYGAKAAEIAADAGQKYREHNRYEADYGMRNTDSQTAGGESEDVLTHELWRPRLHGICPEGFLGIVAGNTALKKTAHPYVHGRIPIVRFTELPDPDSFRPTCAVRDLMSLQRNKNQTRSLLNGYLRATIDPRILVEPGSGFPEDAMSKWPKVIHMKAEGIAKVKALELPPPPAYMGELDQMDTRDMEDVANVHRSTMGQSENSQQSGKHAELMKSGDKLVQVATRTLVEDAASEVGSQIVALMWQYYDEERTLGLLGQNGQYEVMTFKGRSLMKHPPVGPQSANVRCVLTKAREPQDVLDLIKGSVEMGLMDPTNEAHRSTMLRWINEQLPPETDEEAEHRCNAHRENEMLLASAQERSKVRAAYGDNDAAHIREHEQLTTTARYRDAVAQDPQIGMAHWVHMKEHMFGHWLKQLLPHAMQAEVSAYLMQISGGTAPPVGAPGAPAGAGSPPVSPGPGRPNPAGAPGAPQAGANGQGQNGRTPP